jgi:hypothetical protein
MRDVEGRWVLETRQPGGGQSAKRPEEVRAVRTGAGWSTRCELGQLRFVRRAETAADAGRRVLTFTRIHRYSLKFTDIHPFQKKNYENRNLEPEGMAGPVDSPNRAQSCQIVPGMIKHLRFQISKKANDFEKIKPN